MTVHLKRNLKVVVKQHKLAHMVLSDTSETLQGSSRESADRDGPLSASASRSPFSPEPIIDHPTPTPEPPPDNPLQQCNLNQNQPSQTDNPSTQNDRGVPLEQSSTVVMLKVSPEENTEFRRLVDENDNDDLNTDKEIVEDETDKFVGDKCEMDTYHQYSSNQSPKSESQSNDPLETNSLDNKPSPVNAEDHCEATNEFHSSEPTIELRFLVRRREAGALIGKRGSNIKRLRETFRSSMFSIPDTGNGPERVVYIATNDKSLNAILVDLTQLLMEKSPENDEQMELKLLIHSSHAGSIIGIGGQSIKKLRNESKAAIKIYEMCCPLSNERVCAIKAKPHVAVNTIKLIQTILNGNPIKGTIKPYDALHFDLNLVDKYGGYFPDEPIEMMANHYQYEPLAPTYNRSFHESGSGYMGQSKGHYSVWRSPYYREPSCELHEPHNPLIGVQKTDTPVGCQHRATISNQPTGMSSAPRLAGKLAGTNFGNVPSTDTSAKNHTTQHESTGDCDDQQASSKVSLPSQSSVYGPTSSASRFHPYAQQLPGHPNFASCNRLQIQRNQLPLMDGPASYTGAPRLMHPFGSLVQLPRIARCARGPSEEFMHGRCRHGARPCLCMFMPMNLPDVLSSGPFVQMGAFGGGGSSNSGNGVGIGSLGAKNFHYYSRSPSHGSIHKKK